MNAPTEPGLAPEPTAEELGRAAAALDAAGVAADKGLRVAASVPVPAAAYLRLEAAQVRRQVEHVLLGRCAEEGLDALLELGALDALLPEVRALVGFGDGEWRHKDVWKHTKQVVRQSPARVAVRWAALLHDIGKVRTRRIEANGEVHFFGHAEVGAAMFDKLQRRLPLFRDAAALADEVRFLILHHLRASQYDDTWTDSAVRRFAKEMGACLGDLLDLSRADITTKRPERKRRGLDAIQDLDTRVREVQALDARVPPLPTGLGTAIAERFGIPPSPALGVLMKALKAAVDEGRLDAQREPAYYLDHLVEAGLVKP